MKTLRQVAEEGVRPVTRKRIETLIARVKGRETRRSVDTLDALQIQFMIYVVEAWVVWCADSFFAETKSSLLPVSARDGHLLAVDLSEDDLLLVDRAHAKLPERMKHVIAIEFRHSGSTQQKAKDMGISRRAYVERLNFALQCFYGYCQPQIDGWREAMYSDDSEE